MARMIGHTHSVGYGGRDCSCCYPAPSGWKKMNRSAKRRERQDWKREVASGE